MFTVITFDGWVDMVNTEMSTEDGYHTDLGPAVICFLLTTMIQCLDKGSVQVYLSVLVGLESRRF